MDSDVDNQRRDCHMSRSLRKDMIRKVESQIKEEQDTEEEEAEQSRAEQ